MRASLASIAAGAILCCGVISSALADAPRNVIVLIGDGMGLEQVSAAGMYAYGAPGMFAFEGFLHQAEVTT